MNNETSACTRENYPDYLKTLDIFSGLSAECLSQLIESTEWVDVPEGGILCQEGDAADEMYFLVNGKLRVLTQQISGQTQEVATLGPGDMVGEISLLSGVNRTATVEVKEPSALIRVPKQAFEKLADQAPQIIDKVANLARERLQRDQLLRILPTFISGLDEKTRSEIEAKLEWIELKRGQPLFLQGDQSDSIFLLVSGRLKAYVSGKSGESKPLSDIARGEIVGEMGFFTQEPRSASVYALHNSTVAKVDKGVFETLIKQHPAVMMAIVRRLISRLQRSYEENTYKSSLNIAIVPAQKDTPTTEFAQQLSDALSNYGTTFHLNAERFDNLVGIKAGTEKLAPSDPYSIRLYTWLDEQEKSNNFVVYEAGHESSVWSTHCLEQADVVIVVANAKGERTLGPIARELSTDHSDIIAVKQTLALLHEESEQCPVDTNRWLALTGTDTHFHIRRRRTADFERLARAVSGRAVGLVLGGGGADAVARL